MASVSVSVKTTPVTLKRVYSTKMEVAFGQLVSGTDSRHLLVLSESRHLKT